MSSTAFGGGGRREERAAQFTAGHGFGSVTWGIAGQGPGDVSVWPRTSHRSRLCSKLWGVHVKLIGRCLAPVRVVCSRSGGRAAHDGGAGIGTEGLGPH